MWRVFVSGVQVGMVINGVKIGHYQAKKWVEYESLKLLKTMLLEGNILLNRDYEAKKILSPMGM